MIDIKDSKKPFKIAYCSNYGGEIFASSNYAYLSDLYGWLKVENISNHTNPYENGYCLLESYTYVTSYADFFISFFNNFLKI